MILRAPSIPQRLLPADARVVVLVDGQSQAWGTQSYLSEAVNPVWGDTTRYGRIWNKCGLATALDFVDDGAWVPLEEGYGRSGPESIGPELQLAYRLFQVFRRPVDIVKCCRGSTPLNPAGLPMNWHPSTTGAASMWELMRDFYWGPALAALTADFGASNLHFTGVAWLQGAADARGDIPNAASEYGGNLTELLAAYRDLLGPNTAIAVGQSENYHESPVQGVVNTYPDIVEVREAQAAVALADPLAQLYSVDSRTRGTVEAFPMGDDNFHGTGQYQQHLGGVMAATLLSLDSVTIGPGGATSQTTNG